MRTFTQDDAVAALNSRSLAVVPYRARYDALSERLGVGFEAVTAALDAIPLCLRGEAHEERRAAAAQLLAERRPALAQALPTIVEARFGRLRRLGPCDALGEIVVPCVDDVIGAATGLPAPPDEDSLLSRVFSQAMGVARRRRLNAEMEERRRQVAQAFPDEDGRRHDTRLSLLILGRDALIGTVALSLRAHLERLAGEPLSSFPMPAVPTQTGVPFVDREALAAVDLGGAPVGPGETVRVALDGFEGEAEAARLRFFGAGRHLCLGRPLALELMAAISASLAAIGTRVAVVDFRLRKDDVFACPEAFAVEVRP